MIIDCISDLHGEFPVLPGGDLLIIAGDITGSDIIVQWVFFFKWLSKQNYRKKILIGGNHDRYLQTSYPEDIKKLYRDVCEKDQEDFVYLCDSGTEFEGLKIWGSPWTLSFPGINPHCTAFTFELESQLNKKWNLIPADTDILITHCPPYGFLDTVNRRNYIEHVGSKSLTMWLSYVGNPDLHVFGHIHEAYGRDHIYFLSNNKKTELVNCSHMNEEYDPVNPPIRITL